NNVIEIRDPSMGAEVKHAKTAPAKKEPAAGRKKSAASSSVLESRFADSFKAGAADKRKGTPGLYDAVKRSAEVIGRDESELAIWFVAIDRKPIGPIPAKLVHRHQKAKRVEDDSLVWKEGMPDWVPLRNCKELVGLLARLDIEESLTGEPGTEDSPRRGLLAADGGADVVDPLKGHSVGVISDRLDAQAVPEPTSAPAVLDAAIAETGLMAPQAASPEQLDGGFFSDDFSAGMESSIADIQSISPPQVTGADRWVKFAAVGFFGLAIVVLVVVLFFTGGSAEGEVVKEVVEVVKERVVEVEREKIVYRDRPVLDMGESGAQQRGSKGGGGGKKGGGKKGGGERDLDAEKRKLLEQMGIHGPSGDHKLVGAQAGDKKGGSGGSSSSALSEGQIRSTVNKNRSSLQMCYERSLKQGEAPEDRDVKVLTRFTVAPSGMVKTVNVGGSGAKLSGLKSCIERSVKKWVFPASSGTSPVDFPTLFTPK
ncbi:MAG: DUF4339 domain-containing protein, partial [Deltaproteobacteria bacterium]|nr:DUF4339 domain-containing protein [Deltaproteobacteria bacterium]